MKIPIGVVTKKAEKFKNENKLDYDSLSIGFEWISTIIRNISIFFKWFSFWSFVFVMRSSVVEHFGKSNNYIDLVMGQYF